MHKLFENTAKLFDGEDETPTPQTALYDIDDMFNQAKRIAEGIKGMQESLSIASSVRQSTSLNANTASVRIHTEAVDRSTIFRNIFLTSIASAGIFIGLGQLSVSPVKEICTGLGMVTVIGGTMLCVV